MCFCLWLSRLNGKNRARRPACSINASVRDGLTSTDEIELPPLGACPPPLIARFQPSPPPALASRGPRRVPKRGRATERRRLSSFAIVFATRLPATALYGDCPANCRHTDSVAVRKTTTSLQPLDRSFQTTVGSCLSSPKIVYTTNNDREFFFSRSDIQFFLPHNSGYSVIKKFPKGSYRPARGMRRLCISALLWRKKLSIFIFKRDVLAFSRLFIIVNNFSRNNLSVSSISGNLAYRFHYN